MENYAQIKADYVQKLNRYLAHKNVLARNSKYYKVQAIAEALKRCNAMFQHSLKNCDQYGLDKICQLVLLHKQYLRSILPNANNASYKSSCANIESIISFAEGYKK